MMFALAGWLLFFERGHRLAAGRRPGAGAGVRPGGALREGDRVHLDRAVCDLSFRVRARGCRCARSWRRWARCWACLRFISGCAICRAAGSPQEGVTYPPLADRVILMLRALGDYTSLIFLPGQSPHGAHGLERAGLSRAWTPGSRICAGNISRCSGSLTIAAFVFACWSRLPGRKIRILGVSWFVLGFLPISNFFPLNAQVAEHWIYMASAGFLLMLAGFARGRSGAISAAPGGGGAAGGGGAGHPHGVSRRGLGGPGDVLPADHRRRGISRAGEPEPGGGLSRDKGKLKEAEAILRDDAAGVSGLSARADPAGDESPGAGPQSGGGAVSDFSRASRGSGRRLDAAKLACGPQSRLDPVQRASARRGGRDPRRCGAALPGCLGPGAIPRRNPRGEQGARGGAAGCGGLRRAQLVAHRLAADAGAAAHRGGRLPGGARGLPRGGDAGHPHRSPLRAGGQGGDHGAQLPGALEAQATAISRGPALPAQYMMLAAILNQMNQPEQAMAAQRVALALRAGGSGG